MGRPSNNDFADYICSISFRLYQPATPPWLYESLAKVAARFGRSLEIWNTKLPSDSPDIRERLVDLSAIPRMSTYAIAAIINTAVSRMPSDQCFVNVGVWHGFTLLAGMMGNADKKCIGIDNFSEYGSPRERFNTVFRHFKSANHFFYDMGYEQYFAEIHQGPIGFYIYDGEHNYDNQLKGLMLAEPYFAHDAIILIDDTNLRVPRQALEDFRKQSKNRYELLLDRRTRGNLHPTWWNGVMVLQRVG